MKNKQLPLFNHPKKPGPKPRHKNGEFGGSLHKKYNPNRQRPFNPKKALHIVLRSSQAKGTKSFKNPTNEKKIWNIIRKQAKDFDLKIYEYANAGNHLHILLRAKDRENYRSFIRAITGLIARHVTNTERGKQDSKRNFHSRKKSLSRKNSLSHINPTSNKTHRPQKLRRPFWDARPFSRIVSFYKKEFHAVKSYLLRNTLEAIGWLKYVPRDKKLDPNIRAMILANYG